MSNRFIEGFPPGCRHSTVDVGDNSTTVYTGRCYLIGIHVNVVLSAHACVIKDNTTSVLTIPASAAAGTFYPCHGMEIQTSLVVDPDDAGTGNLTVMYYWDR